MYVCVCVQGLYNEAEVAELAAASCNVVVVAKHHAALSRGDVLVGVEAHGANVTKAATRLALVGLANHLGGILCVRWWEGAR